MSSCVSAHGRFGAVTTEAFGRASNEAAFDGTHACEQQVMDALSDYQAACDKVDTLTGDYSDTKSLQSFCLQKKGIRLAIPGESGTVSVQTQVLPTSTDSGFLFRTSSSAAAPTASSVPAGAGAVAATSNSIALYAGIGAGIAFVVIGVIVCLVSQKRRKQASLERLEMEYTYQPNSQKVYNMPSAPHYPLSGTAAVPTPPPPAANLQHPAEPIKSSENQDSSGKIPIPSSSGEEKSNTLGGVAIPISAPPSKDKSSMMNASYVTSTSSNEKQRDNGSNSLDMSVPQVTATLNPNEWSVSEVVAWARDIPHFGTKIGNIMLEYQVSGRVLMGLTRDSMKDELGLVFGEVSQLEASIAQLRGELLAQEQGLPPSYDA
ncbi:hypothetical protein HDU81_010808 [Chytriomyces hyalinus]|nr:hypothetical protein HDU81_010808 [Chytriomyces hyalinus]